MKYLVLFVTVYLKATTAIGVWKQLNYSDPTLISPREQCVGAFISQTQEFFILGGLLTLSPLNIIYNDVFAINMTSLQTTKLPDLPMKVDGKGLPLGLYGSAYTVDPESGALYVQGGKAAGSSSTRMLWEFDSIQRKSTELVGKDGEPKPDGSLARSFHCLEFDQDSRQLIVFGGYTDQLLNDVWILDIESSNLTRFTKPEDTATSLWIQGRCKHSCAIGPESKFYVHGGITEHNIAQDLWQFDLAEKKWSLVSPGTSKVKAIGHSMKFSEKLNSLIIFVGFPTWGIFQYELTKTASAWIPTTTNSGGSFLKGIQNFVTGYNAKTGEYYVFTRSKDGTSNELWSIQLEDLTPSQSQSNTVSSKPPPTPTPKPVNSTTAATKPKADKQKQEPFKPDSKESSGSTEGYGSFYTMLFIFIAVLMIGFYFRLRKTRAGAPQREYNQLQNVTSNNSSRAANNTSAT